MRTDEKIIPCNGNTELASVDRNTSKLKSNPSGRPTGAVKGVLSPASMETGTAKHLVVACCHGTYHRSREGFTPKGPTNEDNWILQSFQRSDPRTGKEGEHLTFIKHINAAVSLLREDPNAMLVFSGGKTQTQIDVTEAASYLQCCKDVGKLENTDRMALEDQATDSYQNLLFAVLVFRRRVGLYPERITVVTHAFKERRFLELHARAIKWPEDKVTVLGIDPPFKTGDREETMRGELLRGYGLFAKDLYGTRDPLAKKRRDRGWNGDVAFDCGSDLEPQVQSLLAWDGGADGQEVCPDRLPWQTA